MNLNVLAKQGTLTLVLSMLCLAAFAQKATGIVKDALDEPMIGVNVLVQGTTNGTITDFDGKFTIDNVPANATLTITYIGYLAKEVKTGQDLIIPKELKDSFFTKTDHCYFNEKTSFNSVMNQNNRRIKKEATKN